MCFHPHALYFFVHWRHLEAVFFSFFFFSLTVFTRKYTRGTRIDASVAVGFYFVLVLLQPTIVCSEIAKVLRV